MPDVSREATTSIALLDYLLLRRRCLELQFSTRAALLEPVDPRRQHLAVNWMAKPALERIPRSFLAPTSRRCAERVQKTIPEVMVLLAGTKLDTGTTCRA